MKNRISIATAVVLLLLPGVCAASYLITLKNGATFVTEEYWEEDNQIKFFAYDGVMGIEKSLVSGIKESVLPVYQPLMRSSKPDREIDTKPAAKYEEPAKINMADPHEEKKTSLTKKLEEAGKEILSAETTGDASAGERAKKRYLEIRKELLELQKQLMDKNSDNQSTLKTPRARTQSNTP